MKTFLRFFPVEFAFLVLGAWAYWPVLRRIFDAWISNPDYTHGFLVVPFAIGFLWLRRNQRLSEKSALSSAGSRQKKGLWEGLGLLALAGVVRLVASRLYLPELDAWSIPLWLGGIVLIFHGRAVFLWALPSIAFLWFATPLPGTIEIALSTPLQKVATSLSGWTLRLLGQPAITEGTTILLDEHVLDVERACSGMRMFYGVFALAVACVIIARPSLKKGLLILFSAAPIAIIANVFRVTTTGLLLRHVSGEAAHKFSHDIAGLVMIPLAVSLFLLLLMLIDKITNRFQHDSANGAVWLIRWGVIVGMLLAGILFWGHRQQRNTYGALLKIADRYEKQEDWPNAATYLQRYISVSPEDHGALAHFAEVYSKIARGRRRKMRSISFLKSAWKKNPDRIDLAFQAVQTTLEVREYRSAIRLCSQLLPVATSAADRATLAELRADSLLGYLRSENARGDYSWQDVSEVLEEVRRLKDSKIRHFVALAEIWREELTEPDEESRISYANDILDGMVADHSDDPLAWIARYRFHRKYVSDDQESLVLVEADLKQALAKIGRADPSDQADIYRTAATRSLELASPAEAESYLKLAIAVLPTNPLAYISLAELKRTEGSSQSIQEAIALLEEAVEKTSDQEISLLLPLASLHVASGDFAAAQACMKPVEKSLPRLKGLPKGLVKLGAGLVQTKILMQSEGLHPAIRKLDTVLNSVDVRKHQNRMPELMTRGHAMLADLYTSVQSFDQAAGHYRLATQINPNSKSTRLQLAKSSMRAGDLDTSEFHFRRLLADDPTSEEAWVAMANIQIHRQMRKRKEARNWTAAERVLRKAQKQQVSNLSLLLVEVELRAVQENFEASEELLAAAVKQWPAEPAIWRAMAKVQQRKGDYAESLDTVEKYLALSPEKIEPYVQKAMLLARANRTQEAVKVLTDLQEVSTGEHWTGVTMELARLQLLLGQVEEAKLLLEGVHEKIPSHLRVINMLANLAWVSSDWESLERYEAWLHKVEGKSGTLWRLYRAQRLLANVTATDDPLLEEAVLLNEEILTVRPRWSKSHLLRGDIAFRSGRIESAIAAFQKAWKLGDRSVLLADRLIDLLSQKGRFAEAKNYVAQIREYLSLSSRLFDRAAPYYTSGDDRREALRLAESWVQRQPENSNAKLRLGRVLLTLVEETDAEDEAYLTRAEKAFQEAIKIAPTEVRAWIANVLFYAQNEETVDKALELMLQFSEQVEIDPLSRAFVLAQLYESLAKPIEAHQHYSAAIQLIEESDSAKEKIGVLTRAAEFYQLKMPMLAGQYARDALVLDGSSKRARKVLLQVLAKRTDSEAVQEGLSLLDQNMIGDQDEVSLFERRMLANLLSRRGSEKDRSDAIDLLETLLQKTADDKLLLASLYERSERLGPAFELLSSVIRGEKPRPVDNAAFLQFWQTYFLEEAGDALTQFGGRAKRVYAQMASTPGQHGEWLRWKIKELRISQGIDQNPWETIRPLIEERLAANQDINQWRRGAKLAWFRSILQVLLEENAHEVALKYVQETPEWLPMADAAVAFCHALILTPELEEIYLPANELLSSVQEQKPQNAALAQAIGDYLFMTGQYERAVASYRLALSVQPDRHLARNNLALSLAEQPETIDDAKIMIEEAIQERPDDPVLLDTHAILNLIRGDARAALQLLQKAIAANPKDATARLHAAMGYHSLGDEGMAQAAFFEAIGLGVNQVLLSPRDRKFLREMHELQNRKFSTRPANEEPLLSTSLPNQELPVAVSP